MEKFLVLYMAPVAVMEAMMKNMTPAEQQAGMDEWKEWMKAHAADFADMGKPAGKTKRVTAGGIEDVKNDVMGYSIVQAESHDAAAKLMEGGPHTKMPGAYVEVMALMNMEM